MENLKIPDEIKKLRINLINYKNEQIKMRNNIVEIGKNILTIEKKLYELENEINNIWYSNKKNN